ncbi:putative reverse transcriptase domain-containing protein [Tanacetum coccineum]
MTDKYCPRGEVKKLEGEMWNLKVKGTDVGLVRRNLTDDLNLYAQNATITMTMSVLQNATSATELAIWPVTGHFKRECPKLKNNNYGNQGGNGNAPAKVYAVGRVGKNSDSNVVTDLMLVELGSFDVIIGMDWLAKNQAVNVCAEKIVRIPWGNETLIVRGDGSDWGNKTRLNIILCTKTQKYMLKGCHVFLAHVTTNETKDWSEKK